jgi:hypothetical protein
MEELVKTRRSPSRPKVTSRISFSEAGRERLIAPARSTVRPALRFLETVERAGLYYRSLCSIDAVRRRISRCLSL